jgi:hypothetical protein
VVSSVVAGVIVGRGTGGWDGGCKHMSKPDVYHTGQLLLTEVKGGMVGERGWTVRWWAWVSLYNYTQQGVRGGGGGTNIRTLVAVVLYQLGS